MAAGTSLDRGFLVRGEHVVVFAKGLAFPLPRVEVEHPACFSLEIGVPGEDPRPVPPRLDGVVGKPAPHRRPRDLGHNATAYDLSGDVGDVKA